MIQSSHSAFRSGSPWGGVNSKFGPSFSWLSPIHSRREENRDDKNERMKRGGKMKGATFFLAGLAVISAQELTLARNLGLSVVGSNTGRARLPGKITLILKNLLLKR